MWHLSNRFRTNCGRAAAMAAVLGLATIGWHGPASGQSVSTADKVTPVEPAWKSSPFHGVIDGDGHVIPCRCLYRGTTYRLGEKVCMDTYRGTVMTECDMQQNNTSWVPTTEACTTS